MNRKMKDIILKADRSKNVKDRICILTDKTYTDTDNNMYAKKEQDRLFKDVAVVMGIILPRMQTLVDNGTSESKMYYKWYIESLLMNMLMSTTFMFYGKTHFITTMSHFYDMLDLPEDMTVLEWLNDADNQCDEDNQQ